MRTLRLIFWQLLLQYEASYVAGQILSPRLTTPDSPRQDSNPQQALDPGQTSAAQSLQTPIQADYPVPLNQPVSGQQSAASVPPQLNQGHMQSQYAIAGSSHNGHGNQNQPGLPDYRSLQQQAPSGLGGLRFTTHGPGSQQTAGMASHGLHFPPPTQQDHTEWMHHAAAMQLQQMQAPMSQSMQPTLQYTDRAGTSRDPRNQDRLGQVQREPTGHHHHQADPPAMRPTLQYTDRVGAPRDPRNQNILGQVQREPTGHYHQADLPAMHPTGDDLGYAHELELQQVLMNHYTNNRARPATPPHHRDASHPTGQHLIGTPDPVPNQRPNTLEQHKRMQLHRLMFELPDEVKQALAKQYVRTSITDRYAWAARRAGTDNEANAKALFEQNFDYPADGSLDFATRLAQHLRARNEGVEQILRERTDHAIRDAAREHIQQVGRRDPAAANMAIKHLKEYVASAHHLDLIKLHAPVEDYWRPMRQPDGYPNFAKRLVNQASKEFKRGSWEAERAAQYPGGSEEMGERDYRRELKKRMDQMDQEIEHARRKAEERDVPKKLRRPIGAQWLDPVPQIQELRRRLKVQRAGKTHFACQPRDMDEALDRAMLDYAHEIHPRIATVQGLVRGEASTYTTPELAQKPISRMACNLRAAREEHEREKQRRVDERAAHIKKLKQAIEEMRLEKEKFEAARLKRSRSPSQDSAGPPLVKEETVNQGQGVAPAGHHVDGSDATSQLPNSGDDMPRKRPKLKLLFGSRHERGSSQAANQPTTPAQQHGRENQQLFQPEQQPQGQHRPEQPGPSQGGNAPLKSESSA